MFSDNFRLFDLLSLSPVIAVVSCRSPGVLVFQYQVGNEVFGERLICFRCSEAVACESVDASIFRNDIVSRVELWRLSSYCLVVYLSMVLQCYITLCADR